MENEVRELVAMSSEELADLEELLSSVADAHTEGAAESDVPAPVVQAVAGLNSTTRKLPAASKAGVGRKKSELAYLRKSVADLETRLAALRHVKGLANGAGNAAHLSSSGGEEGSNSSLWHEIAMHQSDERHRVEAENVRLRLVLESQLKVARGLESVLQRKASVALASIGKSVDVRRQEAHLLADLFLSTPLVNPDRQHQFFGSDAEIFQTLLAGVERSMRDIDAVFVANGLASTATPGFNAQVHTKRDSGVEVEICATKVLPFGIRETGEAVWNHYLVEKQHLPMRYYAYIQHKSLDATQDTVAESLTVEILAKNTSAHLRVRKVLRRIIEEDREVVAWHTYFDPVEFSAQRLSGIRFLQKGYVMIRRAPPSPPSSLSSSSEAPPRTLLQPCYIMSPLCVEGDADNTVGAISDFMLSATAINIAATHQMIENVLLGQSLERREKQGSQLAAGGVL